MEEKRKDFWTMRKRAPRGRRANTLNLIGRMATVLAFALLATGCATPKVQPADPELVFKSDLLVFLQNGVYFTQGQKLKDTEFTGTAYALEDDKRLRGLTSADRKDIQEINYDSLIDLIVRNDKVTGMF